LAKICKNAIKIQQKKEAKRKHKQGVSQNRANESVALLLQYSPKDREVTGQND